MAIVKEIKGNELYLWMNGNLIYKRWLDKDTSKVFDKMAYGKYTYTSFTDLEINNTDQLVIVRALFKANKTEEGGRSTPFKSGLRPNHVFESPSVKKPRNTFVGDINFDDRDLFYPGEEAEVIVRFLFHMPIEQYLHKGRRWWIYEGDIKTGEAEILEIIKTT